MGIVVLLPSLIVQGAEPVSFHLATTDRASDLPLLNLFANRRIAPPLPSAIVGRAVPSRNSICSVASIDLTLPGVYRFGTHLDNE